MTRICAPLVYALLAAAVAATMVGCGEEPTPTPTPVPTATPTPTPVPTPTPTPTPTPVPRQAGDSLIPEGAALVVDADPATLLGSSVVTQLLDAFSGGQGTGEGLFSEFESVTGIPMSSVNRVEMYLDLETVLNIGLDPETDDSGPPPAIGIVLRGDLDEADFTVRLAQAMAEDPAVDYVEETYRGYTMQVDAGGDPESFSFAFADADTLVFGATDAVKRMLDVASGAAQAISGEAINALESMGDRDLGMIMAIPPEVLADAMQSSPEEQGLLAFFGPGALAPLAVTTMSVDDESLQLGSRQFFDDENAATAAREFNESTMSIMGTMSGSPELQALFANIQISQSGSEVAFEMTLDAASAMALQDFLNLFTQLSGG